MVDLWRGSARRQHERARHREHHRAVVLDPALADFHDAPAGSRSARTKLEDFVVRVQRLALEEWIRKAELIETERESVLAGLRDEEPGDDPHGEAAVHERSLEWKERRVMLVEMDLVRVVGEQRVPDVVGLRHRAAKT